VAKRKYFWPFILLFLVFLIYWDRGNWANIAQWREDQSTNLWLGYTQNIFNIPVGLISSVRFPNPNGMALLGELLSRLPNLWFVSLALGLIQGGLILWIGWLLFEREYLFFGICLPALASIVLRATSVEFWNQWMITLVNLFFWGLWIAYLRKPGAWKIFLLILPVLIAPALYLAGIVNAIVFVLFILTGIRIAPPQGNRKSFVIAGILGVLLVILSAWLTWIPYFRAAIGYPLPGAPLSWAVARDRVFSAIGTCISFPVWSVKLWSTHMENLFYQGSIRILPGFTIGLFRITRLFLFVQSAITLPIIILGILYRRIGSGSSKGLFTEGHEFQGYILLAGLLSVNLAYMLSPLLGGPVWASGERMDQQIQFFPFLLFAWFVIPFLVNLPRWITIGFRGLSVAVAAGFILIGLISGNQIILAHLNYRGDYLSEADVPLRDKMQAVEFIALDWRSISGGKPVPIYYDLGGGTWDWVPYTGDQMKKWYPAPFTMGRGLDFELLRVYGLPNSQEGIQFRSPESVRYIVSYAFLPEPILPGVKKKDYIFGRLRVTVVFY
jgi:hypothetical protein